MGRLRLGAILACSLAAIAAPARAAEITSVASTEPNDAFDLRVSIRWDRQQEKGKITREQADPSANPPFGEVVDVDELRYSRVRNAIVPRVAIALYRDLELHAEIPYVLGDDQSWEYAKVNGLPVEPNSTIRNNTIDAMNQPCAVQPCPIFPVGSPSTVFHGGRAGDLVVGMTWGIFNDQRDDTKPSWTVGGDLTFPTAALYDPAAGRAERPTWSSPFSSSGHTGPVGEKVWKYDLYTAISRRIGPIDPYFRAHVTGMHPSSKTYSNCDHVAELAGYKDGDGVPVAQMTNAAIANCADASWKADAGAQLPWIAGLTFGTELVPYESRREEQKVTIDVRLFADYTSSQRFYNPLTDATGKLLRTEAFLTAGGMLGVYLRASHYVSLHANASLAMNTAHFLSGESLGRAGVDAPGADVTGVTSNANLNPNFDWRYDAPGRRFRIAEDTLFAFSVAGVLQF